MSFIFALLIGLAFLDDSATAQNLFVAGGGSGKVFEFTPAGAQSTFASGLGTVFGLAFDSSGDLFVGALGSAGTIYKFTPWGAQSTFATASPYFIAVNSAGNLFVADSGPDGSSSGNIYEYTPAGVRSTFASGLNLPNGMAFDSANNLYVAVGNGNIDKITPGGVQSVFATGLATGIAPAVTHKLAFDNSGNLIVTEPQTGTVYEFAPNGTKSTLASGLNLPNGVACDSAGDVFVMDIGSHTIFEFTAGVQSTFATGVQGPSLAFPKPPVPYGNSPFTSFDQQSPPVPVPFFNCPAYLPNNDTIYAVSGPDNSQSDDEISYGIHSDLSGTSFPPNFLQSGVPFDSDSSVGSPAVGNDGTAYVATTAGMVSAIDSSGNIKWTYQGINQDGGNILSSPSIGLDGNIYVATDDGNRPFVFYSIDPELGLPKWKLLLNSPFGDVDTSPLCAASGIYGVDEDGLLHFVTYFGQEFTGANAPLQVGTGEPSASPAITANGLLVIGGFSFAGGFQWTLQIVDPVAQQITQTILLDGNMISASPVIGPDGNIYVGTTGGNFFAISQPNASAQAQIIAEISLGSPAFPTTAAVGSDSRVYVGTSINSTGSAPGQLFSMHLQAVCGQTFPYQFVIDWQTQVTDGGFLGSPLIAQVGANHATNVVYAANTDGNIYAFLASAGPSTNTWSTFQGNDQRQGNWNPSHQTITPPNLWSVQFGSPTSLLNQSGKAAYGNRSTDYWNPAAIPNNSSQWSYTVKTYSQGTPSITIVSASSSDDFNGADVPAADQPFQDNLMAHFMYSTDPSGSFTFNIENLPTQAFNGGPAALYDVYVYAYGGQNGSASLNSQIMITPPANDPILGSVSTLTTSETLPSDLTHFAEGQEYVVFRNVPVSQSSPTIQITVNADTSINPNNVPMINGLQIVAKQ